MPLAKLKDEYLEQEDGVRFLMADDLGNTIACKVSHEALRAHAERIQFPGPIVPSFRRIGNSLNSWLVTLSMPRGHSTTMAACLSPLKRLRG
jgi:hypothetical protein